MMELFWIKLLAQISQLEGVKRAFDSRFRHDAVSAAGFQAKATSEISDIAAGVGFDVLFFSVCNTCVGKMSVEHIIGLMLFVQVLRK